FLPLAEVINVWQDTNRSILFYQEEKYTVHADTPRYLHTTHHLARSASGILPFNRPRARRADRACQRNAREYPVTGGKVYRPDGQDRQKDNKIHSCCCAWRYKSGFT